MYDALGQTDLRVAFALELVVKSLPGTLVRICNCDRVLVRKLTKPLKQQWHARLKQGQHGIAEVETFLLYGRQGEENAERLEAI